MLTDGSKPYSLLGSSSFQRLMTTSAPNCLPECLQPSGSAFDLGNLSRENKKYLTNPGPESAVMKAPFKAPPSCLPKASTKDSGQPLDVQLQNMIDKELSAAATASFGADPDECISRQMEASLRLWNNLTEVRNNYKVELKKKQEERVSFENDLRAATAQTTSELNLLERDLERTNQKVYNMECQISQAEKYRRKLEDETKSMEEELRSFSTEDETLQKEMVEVCKAIQTVEVAISQAEVDFQRHKADAEKELTQAEMAYSKEIDAKDQQIAASTVELQQLEQQLSDFSRNNAQEAKIRCFKEELDRLRMDSDMIKSEIYQIHQRNIDMRRNGEAQLAMAEGNLKKEQYANELEDEKMAQEVKSLEKKLQSVESTIRQLEQDKAQLEKQTTETETEMEKMQYDIKVIIDQVNEKEQAMKEMCTLIEQQEALEQELETKFNEDLKLLERKTNEKIRDIKNQMMACSQKKQENMTRIRNLCDEIKDSKAKLKDTEDNAQGTFKRLKELTDEYNHLKKQNRRSEEFISFYDNIRNYESKYVDMKTTLARAKDHRNFRREGVKEEVSPLQVGKPIQKERGREEVTNVPEYSYKNHSNQRNAERFGCQREDDCGTKNSSGRAERPREASDPLADPLIQAYFKVNKTCNQRTR